MLNSILLRDFKDVDLISYFEFQKDPDANFMAAFTIEKPDSWIDFKVHWNKILSDEDIIVKSILFGERVIGNLLSFLLDGQREVSYWIDKDYWGRGIATYSLRQFLSNYKIRPLYARAAFDNIGSIRVLKKCGFKNIGNSDYYSNARNKQVREEIFILKNS